MPKSVRMRITPAELSALIEGQVISQRLGPGSWQIEISKGEESRLTLKGALLRVDLAQHDVDDLADPFREGIYLDSEHEPSIVYFLEKDFPCVHPRHPKTREVSTETFEPPHGFSERHRKGSCF